MPENTQGPEPFEITNTYTAEGQRQLAGAVIMRAKNKFWANEDYIDKIAKKRGAYSPFHAADDTIEECVRLDINPFDLLACLGKNTSLHSIDDYDALVSVENPSLNDIALGFASRIVTSMLYEDYEIDAEASRRYESIGSP